MAERTRDNVAHLAGIVGTDPETVQGGRSNFVSFRLATTLRYPDRDAGEEDSVTRWYSVAVNRPALQAWTLDNIRKGSRVVLEGFKSRKERDDGDYWYNFAASRIGFAEWAPSDYQTKGAGSNNAASPSDQADDDDW
jgi:single-strand DNA-binding protein